MNPLALLAAASLTIGPMTVPDSARLLNGRLVIRPMGVSLKIPPLWLGGPIDPARSSGVCSSKPSGDIADRVVVERARLPKLQSARGEWRREYEATMDSTLPFGAVIAQLGGDPWVGGSCGAPQLRLYAGEPNLMPRDADFSRGIAAARAFFSPVNRRTYETHGWRVTHLSWDADYGDYGGTANVEFWARLVGRQALVLVFTYEGEKEYLTVDLDGIANSFTPDK